MKTLLETIVERDDISLNEAKLMIIEAKQALNEYIEEGDMEAAENVCEEYFGLEPDFLVELIHG